MSFGFGEQRKHGGKDQGGYEQDTDACSVHCAGLDLGHAVQSVGGNDEQEQHDPADDECD